MINSKLTRFEWQESMDIVLQYVNLYSINVSHENGMLFNFLNSTDGKYDRSIQCRKIWKCQFEGDSSLEYPIFILDVMVKKLSEVEVQSACEYLKYGFEVPNVSDCYLLCMEGGDASFIIFCGYVKTIKG